MAGNHHSSENEPPATHAAATLWPGPRQPGAAGSPSTANEQSPLARYPAAFLELALAIVVQSADVKLSAADSRLLRFRMAAITQQLQVTAAQLTFALVFLRRVYVASPTNFLAMVADSRADGPVSLDDKVHRCLVLLFTTVGIGRKCIHDTSRRRIGQWNRLVGQCLNVRPVVLSATEVNLLFAVQFRLHVPAATFEAWVAFLEGKVLQIETARQQAAQHQRNVAAAIAAATSHELKERQRDQDAESIAKRRCFSVNGPLAVGNHALSLENLADVLKSPAGATALVVASSSTQPPFSIFTSSSTASS